MEQSNKSFVFGSVRCVAGGTLVMIAAIHIAQPYYFTYSLAAFQVFPAWSLTLLPIVLASTQLIVGIWIMLSNEKPVLWLAAVLFLIFFMFQVQAITRGLDIACGCFGFSSHHIGWQTLLVPALMGAGCLASLLFERSPTEYGDKITESSNSA